MLPLPLSSQADRVISTRRATASSRTIQHLSSTQNKKSSREYGFEIASTMSTTFVLDLIARGSFYLFSVSIDPHGLSLTFSGPSRIAESKFLQLNKLGLQLRSYLRCL